MPAGFASTCLLNIRVYLRTYLKNDS
jgi:hypothetical protein